MRSFEGDDGRIKSRISSSSRAADDFQKLVVMVAALFCITQLTNAIDHGLLDFAGDDDDNNNNDDNNTNVNNTNLIDDGESQLANRERIMSKSFFWIMFFQVLNSTGNLFVYLAASKKFRLDFARLLRRE